MIELTPALKTTTKIKFSTYGKWENNQPMVLHELADSFNINLDNPPKLELTAIPDMWARPLLFKSALFDKSHIIHKRIVDEWRGLLAIFALRDVLSCNFSVMKVEINDSNDFSRSLSELKPTETLEPATTWNEHYIILYCGEPIGITSPVTLVCTGAEYRIKDVQRVSWVDMCNGVTYDSCGDRLTDPVMKLNPTQKTLLVSWLVELKSNLMKISGLKKGANDLFTQLDDFIKDLGCSYQAVKFSQSDLGMSGIFRNLNKPAIGTPTGSAVKLIRDKLNGYPDMLIVDESIAEQWDVELHEILVNNHSHLGLKVNNDKFYNNQPLPQGTIIKDAASLFAKKLHLVTMKNAMSGAFAQDGVGNLDFEGDDVTPIVPVAKELLHYFSAEKLSSMVRFEQIDSDSIKCILTLQLSGIDGNQRDFLAEKIFKASEKDIVGVSENPVCSVWPNFKMDTWRLYYFYYSTQGKDNCFYATPYNVGKENQTENIQTYSRHNNIEREITQLEEYPDAFICSYKGENAGVMLAKEPQRMENAGVSNWRIGVDFGTTGTNVCFSVGDSNKPTNISFKNRYFHITSTGESESDIYRYCFHSDEKVMKMPFLTIYKDTLNNPNQQIHRPLLDGNIYFMRVHDDYPTDGKLVENLKWGHTASSDQLKLLTSYIKQLCIQSLAEAAVSSCTSANWYFSYPASFSGNHGANFQNSCTQIIKDCEAETGIRCCKEPPKYELESVVAANYFQNYPGFGALFASGALSIDIGGGTSDISLWQNNELINQTSIKLAGRTIFNSLLVKNAALNKKLYNLDSMVSVLGVDIYNRDNSLSTLKSLGNHINDPLVQNFTRSLLLGVSSILYYAGLIVRHKIMNKEYSVDRYPPEIFIAGGGANILHWIAGGNYSINHPVSAIMKKIFISAARLKNISEDDFKIQISPEPKAEAAQGLVYDMLLVASQKNMSKHNCLAGENFIVNGKQSEWYNDINIESLVNGVNAESSLTQINEFLNLFNSCCSEYGFKPIENTAVILRKVSQSLPSDFIKWKNCKDTSSIEIEPVFILAFRKLWEIVSDDSTV